MQFPLATHQYRQFYSRQLIKGSANALEKDNPAYRWVPFYYMHNMHYTRSKMLPYWSIGLVLARWKIIMNVTAFSKQIFVGSVLGKVHTAWSASDSTSTSRGNSSVSIQFLINMHNFVYSKIQLISDKFAIISPSSIHLEYIILYSTAYIFSGN